VEPATTAITNKLSSPLNKKHPLNRGCFLSHMTTTLSPLQPTLETDIRLLLGDLSGIDQIGLYTGVSGLALSLSYAGMKFQEPVYLERAGELILQAFEVLQEGNFNTTFCSGLSGVLWAVEHLQQKQMLEIEDDFSHLFPELKASALNYARLNDFDFLHGSGGIVYYLNTVGASDEIFLSTWLELLHQSAIYKEDHIYWDNDITGPNIFNLGLAHGIGSKIVLLAQIASQFPALVRATEMLHGSVRFLLSSENPSGTFSLFPPYRGEGGETVTSRLGWCYGDLSNAIALWQAGKLTGTMQWIDKAVEIVNTASFRRDLDGNGLKDAGICHGTAGLAHIFNRFYLETGKPSLKDAANYWLLQTLEIGKTTEGQGFPAWQGEEKGYVKEFSLLEGTSGIALALLGFIDTHQENIAWDSCLLLS
jgi:lantibiotic modifying enzyme